MVFLKRSIQYNELKDRLGEGDPPDNRKEIGCLNIQGFINYGMKN